MSREQQIIDAGIEYTMQNNPICIGGDNFYEASKMLNRNSSFEAGAKWADAHPKSPWISVKDDLPCNHEELLNPDDKRDTSYVVTIIHGYVIMSRMYKLNGKWYWENDEPTHWFPIPKLP